MRLLEEKEMIEIEVGTEIEVGAPGKLIGKVLGMIPPEIHEP
jgi:hypothetical protein